MRKRSTYRPRTTRVPAFVDQSARWLKAREIARPMRAMFDLLERGEVYEVQGKAVMDMPELDDRLRQCATDWVEIAPAIRGWIDVWARLAPKSSTVKLGYLADRLDQGKELTPRLVEQAREEFEACIALIPSMQEGKIKSAVLHTQIKWETERMNVLLPAS